MFFFIHHFQHIHITTLVTLVKKILVKEHVCMYVSHDLSVDKVQSNYGGANHRQSNWIENISGRASGFCVPSRVQLSEHHWSLRLK